MFHSLLCVGSSPFLLRLLLVEQGLAEFNYKKSFFMKIIDKLGAFTKVDGVEITVSIKKTQ